MTQTNPPPHRRLTPSVVNTALLPVQKCVVLSEYLGAFAQVVADLDVAVMS